MAYLLNTFLLLLLLLLLIINAHILIFMRRLCQNAQKVNNITLKDDNHHSSLPNVSLCSLKKTDVTWVISAEEERGSAGYPPVIRRISGSYPPEGFTKFGH